MQHLIAPLPVFGSINNTPLPLSHPHNSICISTITKKKKKESYRAKKKLGGLMKSDWRRSCEAAKRPKIKVNYK